MKNALATALATIAILSASLISAHAQDAVAGQKFFVLIYSAGPTWKPDVPMAKQGLGQHFAYMQSLRAAHQLFVAGPLDNDGGLILLRARSIDAAKDIMAHDPSIIGGIFTGQVHSWRAAVDSGKTASDFLAAPE